MIIKVHRKCTESTSFKKSYALTNTGDCSYGGMCAWCRSGHNTDDIVWAVVNKVEDTENMEDHVHVHTELGERAPADECNFVLGPTVAPALAVG